MAAPTRKMNESWRKITLALVLSAWLLQNGVVCQSDATDIADADPTQSDMTTGAGDVQDPTTGAVTGSVTTADTNSATDASGQDATPIPAEQPAGGTPGTDSTVQTTLAQGTSGQSTEVTPMTPVPSDVMSSVSTAGPAHDLDVPTTDGTVASHAPTDAQTDAPTDPPTDPHTDAQTDAAPILTITDVPKPIIQCVEKEEVQDIDAVKVVLQEASSCEETRAKIEEIVGDLCGSDCKLCIFQEENSKEIIVTGPNIKADAIAMAEKFNSEGIKKKLMVADAVPRWGKPPQTVLISLLVTGLLLAALLIGGYCFKNRRSHSTKGMRLAEESYQADEENQGNTLVSVAPLNPPETQEKPSINGESPEGGKSQPPPAGTGGATTNGHSNAKTPVADTEL
ncbi:hematopoietic progenitor cell antigen CD34-like [Megalops cyprinoides]|uniref:hematopoietic progenitor cell antigen CD34-like n=1 Tax=Megalops cyprinoides TaxID=118141 RepID=UPI001863EE37|nr:hematopoietic progenitor cell antigen CD34-like [Megalops cyprinoides]